MTSRSMLAVVMLLLTADQRKGNMDRPSLSRLRRRVDIQVFVSAGIQRWFMDSDLF